MMFEILSECKGGGYRYCRTNPPHPKRNSKGLYPLHRVILENKLGRFLLRNEDAHHVDGNKENNSEENLEVLTNSEHTRRHKTLPDSLLIKNICDCGKVFYLKPSRFKRRVKNKNGKIFCSRECVYNNVRSEKTKQKDENRYRREYKLINLKTQEYFLATSILELQNKANISNRSFYKLKNGTSNKFTYFYKLEISLIKQ
jgi:hypothetical protein